jgi:hypothetical protein
MSRTPAPGRRLGVLVAAFVLLTLVLELTAPPRVGADVVMSGVRDDSGVTGPRWGARSATWDTELGGSPIEVIMLGDDGHKTWAVWYDDVLVTTPAP